MKKLVIFFPGRKYSVDCPLLYYADFVCSIYGYDKIYMHYAEHREEKSNNSVEKDIENAKEYVLNRIAKITFEDYDEVLFVSKSIGTVLASIAQKEFKLKVKNVYLTPLKPTIPYFVQRMNEAKDNLVIAGTSDSFLNAEKLKKVCQQEKIPLHQFENLGHSMEAENVSESLKYIDEIMKIIENFISQSYCQS